MPRTPSPRDLVAELVACIESDDADQELTLRLVGHSAAIAEAMHTTPAGLRAACAMAPAARAARVQTLVRLAKKRNQAVHARAMAARAMSAARQLAEQARWQKGRVELNAGAVLGRDLRADHGRKYICFDADGYNPVIIMREKLCAASKALRFRGLACWLDDNGLHFAWRQGKGGLVLISRQISADERDLVLPVVMARPRAGIIDVAMHPAAARGHNLRSVASVFNESSGL